MTLCMKSLLKSRVITAILAALPILFCSVLNIWAEEGRIRFDQALDLKVEVNGAFLKDSDGFIWIGSANSLFRYDGYELKTYKVGPKALSGGWIMSLSEDRDGVIWIGTHGGGITAYNKKNGLFRQYKHNPDDPNSLSSNTLSYTNQTIFEDKSGAMWIGTHGGLNRLDKKTDAFTHYRHDPNNANSLSNDKVNAIIEDKSGIIWIGTEEGGLNRFDRTTGTWTSYRHDPNDEKSLSDDNVQSLIEDRDGMLWVGTKGNGLNRFDRANKNFARYTNNPDSPDSIGDNNVFYIHEDSSGRLWLCHCYAQAGNPGLSMFDKERSTFVRYAADPDTPHTISGNSVGCVYDDPETGIFWVADLVGQIDKYDINAQKFNLWQHDPKNSNSLSDNGVTKIYEDKKGMIWIGTFAGGLNKFDKKTGQFTRYTPDVAGFPFQWITGILEDSSGRFWVGSQDVLTLFDKETGKVTRQYSYDADDPHSFTRCKAIRSIIEDRNDSNIIWIGTHGGGLVRLNKEQEKFTIYKHDPEDPGSLSYDVVRIVYDDGKGSIWVPTFKGLNRFDKKTKKFTRYFHDPSNPDSIHSDFFVEAYSDSSGRLWIIGKGGVSRFDEETGTFKNYTKRNGFADELYLMMREDKAGNLWISTAGAGLVKFNPKTESVRIYTEEDGLQSDGFWGDSVWKTRDGQMWFGGANGANSFYPDKITDNPYIPPVILTSFKQGGVDVDLGMAPERLREIGLDWNANFFEFQFAAMNYTMPEKNQYAYMLEGVDNEWYYSGNNPFGRYSNIPGGTYTLRLKGSNNDGIWNHEGTAIKVTVVPPFYRTWWFLSSIGMLITGCVGFIFFQQISRLKVQNEANLLAKEMELARQIQTAILPKDVHHDELEIASAMTTADRVGGDFYDIFYSDEGVLWIAVGDVSGHGVTPGLIMMMAQTVHTTIATHYPHSPREVINTLNQVLCRNVRGRLGENHFMTFTTLKYGGKGMFEYAGAHLSLLVYRQSSRSCELIRTPGTFLNLIEDVSACTVNSSLSLDVGDILVLYSDGLTEAKNQNNELFDIQRFMDLVKTHAGKEVHAMQDAVMQDVLAWCGHVIEDDMSLVVVRRIK